MICRIEIDMTAPAFQGGGCEAGNELARVLADLSRRVFKKRVTPCAMKLETTNGKVCGECRFAEEEDEPLAPLEYQPC